MPDTCLRDDLPLSALYGYDGDMALLRSGRPHRTLRCTCGYDVSAAALHCPQCDRVVGAREGEQDTVATVARPEAGWPEARSLRLEDEVRWMLEEGMGSHAIQMRLIREGWFATAVDARAYVMTLEAQATSRQVRVIRAARSVALRRAVGIVIGVAILTAVVLLGALGKEFGSRFAFEAVMLIGGGIAMLRKLYRARKRHEDLAKLIHFDRDPAGSYEDRDASEIEAEAMQARSASIKDALDAGMRTL